MSDQSGPDGLELTRRQWAQEKAAGHWDESHLERERTARRAWIKEELEARAK
jgi:hypothetical protein